MSSASPGRAPRAVPRHDGAVTTPDDPADAEALARYATALADGIDAAIPGWVDRAVRGVLAGQGIAVDDATAVLRAAGARPVPRDEFSERSFPDYVYDLSPATFADVDPSLHEPGLLWGAAKAHVHLARRRREGRR